MPSFAFFNRRKSAATPGGKVKELDAVYRRHERMKRQMSVDEENDGPSGLPPPRRDAPLQTTRKSSVTSNPNRPVLMDNRPLVAPGRDNKKLRKSTSTFQEDKTANENVLKDDSRSSDTTKTHTTGSRVSKSGHYLARIGSKSGQKRRQSSTLEESWDMTQLSLSMESMLLTSKPHKITDIDALDDDPLNCPTYAKDIIKYLMKLEYKFRVPPRFLKKHPEISSTIRAILVDWLIQVQEHFKLLQETLHLSVSMIDIFIHKHGISLAKLQLLGITCFLIAAKYEERFHPSMKDLVTLTDNCYTVREVTKMEIVVLKAFNFELFFPTPFDFLARMLKVIGDPPPKLEPMARYLLDLSLPDVTLAHLAPSLKAAASVCFARKILGTIPNSPPPVTKTAVNKVKLDDTRWHSITDSMDDDVWTPDLMYHSGYSEEVLQGCMQRYAKLLLRAEHSSLQGARSKYSSKRRFAAISLWPVLGNNEVVKSAAAQSSG